MRPGRIFAVLGVILLAIPHAACAQQAMDGQFRAARDCPALVSIRKGTNPGDVSTAAGESYRIIARNSKAPTHYRIMLPGAEPPERWVAASCGTAEADARPPAASPSAPRERGPEYVLAVSWQPAFCELNARKPECRSLSPGSRAAGAFSLHGLWPQPATREYCGVDPATRNASEYGRWRSLPPVDLSPATRAGLEAVMPGTRSLLERHEWTKHGTCHARKDAEAYFRDSIRLLAAINASPVRELMAGRIGAEVTAAEVRARFDEAFGPGAGERVRLSCRDDGSRRLVVELTIGLKGDIGPARDVGELIRAAPATGPGCPRGIVDPAGQQ